MRSILTRLILFFEVFIFSLAKRFSSRTSQHFSVCIAYSQTAVIYHDFNFKYFKEEKISNFVKALKRVNPESPLKLEIFSYILKVMPYASETGLITIRAAIMLMTN